MRHSILHTPQGMRKITLNAFQAECDTGLVTPNHDDEIGSTYVAPHTATQALPLDDVTQNELQSPVPGIKFILVVDDSPTVRKIVETALGREGYETRSFEDGIEAMKWLGEAQSRTPDLILVDIGLPKIDGYELIRKLKNRPRFAHVPCIVLSRHDGTIDKLKGRLAGAKAHITKPFTIKEFLVAVHTCINSESV